MDDFTLRDARQTIIALRWAHRVDETTFSSRAWPDSNMSSDLKFSPDAPDDLYVPSADAAYQSVDAPRPAVKFEPVYETAPPAPEPQMNVHIGAIIDRFAAQNGFAEGVDGRLRARIVSRAQRRAAQLVRATLLLREHAHPRRRRRIRPYAVKSSRRDDAIVFGAALLCKVPPTAIKRASDRLDSIAEKQLL